MGMGQSRVVTVAITDMPGRRANCAEAGMSRRILTGMRCTTFTKLPVAFSGGKRLKTDPVPGLRLSTVPVNTWLLASHHGLDTGDTSRRGRGLRGGPPWH